MATSDLRVGSLVEVLWGLDSIQGTIVDIYGPPGRPFALVEVPVLGSDGEILEQSEVSVPLDALLPAQPLTA